MNKLIITLALVLAFLKVTPASADEILVSPYDNVKVQIIDLITNSNTSIKIVMYAINDTDIVSALIAAKGRNVDVQVVLDFSQSFMPREKIAIANLKGAGIPVFIGKSLKHSLVHIKMAVFDGKVTEEGSYNYTENASSQDNSCLIINDVATAIKFSNYFDQIKKDLR